MTATWTATDTLTGSTATGDADELETAIRGWNPDAPAEVNEAITDLAGKLRRREYTGAEEAFLAVTIS